MKADLTRSTFRREKHYSGVRMQQGRVQLDADWNEQVDIGAHLDRTTRIDVIGACGMPEGNAGFGLAVTPDGHDLTLTPGRAYVGGILCELDATAVRLESVKTTSATVSAVSIDGRELQVGDWASLSGGGVGPALVRLKSVDAAKLALGFMPALSSADATALDKAGDAVLTRVTTVLTQPDFPGVPPKELAFEGTQLAFLDVWERHVTALEDGEIREVALGGPDTATRAQTVWQVKLTKLDDPDGKLTCDTAPAVEALVAQSSGGLASRAQPETTSADPCTIPPGAGFRRLENQLYRVEVHDSGDLGTATFKWSRENGSVVVGWLGTSGDEIAVTTLGRDDVLGIGPGYWIELTDDTHELAGEPGTMARVQNVAGTTVKIQTPVTGSLDLVDFPVNPKVRRWDDQVGLRTIETPAANDGWVLLEDGIQIHFEAGHYTTGDYWLIPARTATGDVDWPVDSAGDPLVRPREGIVHHYCKLGIVRAGDPVEVIDCRKLFPPLTEIHDAEKEPGLHVVGVRTRSDVDVLNDGDLPVNELATGLEIDLDGNVEPLALRGKPTCFVTVDLPFPMARDDRELWSEVPVGTMPLTLAATVTAKAKRIVWQVADPVRAFLEDRLLKAAQSERLLAHLTLKGNVVFGDDEPTLNVDGEAFGAMAAGGRLDAVLPSGDGRRGGDLELWFWLTPPVGAPPRLGHVILGALVKSPKLTTKQRRTRALGAISLAADRGRLAPDVPQGLELDMAAAFDPAGASAAARRLGLAEPLLIVFEERLVTFAEHLKELLTNVDIRVDLVPAPTLPADLRDLIDRNGPDLVLATSEIVDQIDEILPDEIDPGARLVL